VEIKKPDGPLPFQYLRPSQIAVEGANGAQDVGCEPETGSSYSSFKPWQPSKKSYKSVKPPVHTMSAKTIQPVINVPNSATEFGHEIDDINTRKYKKMSFKPNSGKGSAKKGFVQETHSKNVTAVGYRKPDMGKIEINKRRMSVKDLLVNGGDQTPLQTRQPTPEISEPLKKCMHDTPIDNFMGWNYSKEERCPTRAQQIPLFQQAQSPSVKMFKPAKFSTNSTAVWAPRS